MKKLILVGGGGHCRSCIDVIELEKKYKIVAIIDKEEMLGAEVLGYKILATDAQLSSFISDENHFLITLGQVGSPKRRIELFNLLKGLGANFATVVSPLAHVSSHANVGEGSIIMHHALVNASAVLGENCIINSKALIEHDAVVENHCHISTGAIVNGCAIVLRESFVGSNATVIHNAKVPQDSFVKAGSIAK